MSDSQPATESGTTICPFLLAEAGPWRLATPSREHGCSAFRPSTPLSLEKQERLCLTATHPGCATYVASLAARASRLATVEAHPTRWHLGPTTTTIEDPGGLTHVLAGMILDRRRWPAIPAVVLVTTLLTLAISGFRPSAPSSVAATAAPSSSPTPTPRQTAAISPAPSPRPSLVPSATPPATPAASPSTAPTPQVAYRTYRVRSGDTLGAIANRFGTTVRALADLNDIDDPSRLQIGQVLLIPS